MNIVLENNIRIENPISPIPNHHNPFTDPPLDDGSYFSTIWWGTAIPDGRPLLLKVYRDTANSARVQEEINLLTDPNSPGALTLVCPLFQDAPDRCIVAFSWPPGGTTFDLLPPEGMPGPGELAILLGALHQMLDFLHEKSIYFGEYLGIALWQSVFISTDLQRSWVTFMDYEYARRVTDDNRRLLEDERIQLRQFVEQIYPQVRDVLELNGTGALSANEQNLVQVLTLLHIADPVFVARHPSAIDLVLLIDEYDSPLGHSQF
jgi:hypothetical protein